MLKQKYVLDDELRVVESPGGDRQLGIRRTVSAPSEALEGYIEAVRNFEQRLEDLKIKFIGTVGDHKQEIEKLIKHAEFFNTEFGKNQWGSNYSFDRVRLHYISKLDELKKELRGLQLKEIDSLKSFEKELRDARSELSPFKKFF